MYIECLRTTSIDHIQYFPDQCVINDTILGKVSSRPKYDKTPVRVTGSPRFG